MTTFARTQVLGGNWYGYPVEGIITSLYGATDIAAHANGHSGVDIAAPVGTPVYAPSAATVKDVYAIGVGSDYWEVTFGNSVILDDGDHVLLFGHMVEPPIVSEGQHVEAGDVLGYVGSTGLSTGPHLHFGAAPSSNPYLQRNLGLIDPITLIGGEQETDMPVDPTKVRWVPLGAPESSVEWTDVPDERIVVMKQRMKTVVDE